MNSQNGIIGVYDFNENSILIEMVVNESPDKINFDEFYVPDSSIDKSNWQVPYMEQYISLDGTYKLCETYDTPVEQTKPTRFAFFIYKTGQPEISTPYGRIPILSLEKMPDRLVKIIDFDEYD